MNPSDEPALSVVVTCFNEGRMLLDAVASAESNGGGRHEIILVDGGTKNAETLDTLAGLAARGLRVLHVEDHGPATARNDGIRAARGRYILPLDADNRIRPAYIDRGIDILDARPDVDVVYGDPEFFGARTGRRRVGEFRFGRIALYSFIDTCAVFRKSAWERVGGFDEHLPTYGCDDWDFWMRLFLKGSRFHYVDEVLFDYRARNDSLTARGYEASDDPEWLKYLRAKQLPVTWGQLSEIAADVESWDFPVREFRRAPVRTLVRLIMRAYLPGVRRKLKDREAAKAGPRATKLY